MTHPINDGAAILSTSYWSMRHAREGLPYLSINAGTLWLLVPSAVGQLLDELPSVGMPCALTRSKLDGCETYQLAWLDDPESPYVEIDQRKCDRRLPTEDDDRVLPLVWHFPGNGAEGSREVRRAQFQIGEVVAS